MKPHSMHATYEAPFYVAPTLKSEPWKERTACYIEAPFYFTFMTK